MAPTVPVERIERSIHLVRGQKVILAADLAALYGVVTRRLNEQVKRNRERFPSDFVFQLTPEEDRALTSQFAMSKTGRGGRRTLPFAFTEHGAIMAAMVLKSSRAVELLASPQPKRRQIGFHIREARGRYTASARR